MKKCFFVFWFLFFYEIIFSQTYFQEINQAKKWKEIFPIDQSISSLLTINTDFPSQRIPAYVYKPSFQQLIRVFEAKEFLSPKNIKINKNDKLNFYFTQIKNENFEEILPILEKKASSSNEKSQLRALWVAQIYYLQNQLEKAQNFLLFSYLAPNNDIALHAEYLQALIYFQQKKYNRIKLQFKNWSLTYPEIPIPKKIILLKLYIDIQEKKYKQVLQETKEWKNSENVDIALLRAILYYNIHQFQKAASFLKKVDFTKVSKKQQIDIYYFDLWLALFTHSKSYQRKKKFFTDNFLVKKKDWEYLLFLEQFLKNKSSYQLAQKLPNNYHRMIALLLLEDRKLLTKEQKKDFLEENIVLKNSLAAYYYYTKKALYWQSKKDYSQVLNYLFNAQYQVQFFPTYLGNQQKEKLNISLGITYIEQNKIEKARKIFSDWNSQSSYFPLANYYLAYTFYRQKNPQELLKLPKNIKIPKKYLDNFLFFTAWANYSLGKVDLAITQLQKDKRNISKSLLYAIYFEQKNYKKIVNSFQSVKKKSYAIDKFYILALLNLQKNQLALQYLEKNQKPKDVLYHQLYWKVLLANSNPQKTIDFIQKIKKEQKNTAIFSAYLAEAFFFLKEYNHSLKYLQETIVLHQKTPEINYNIFLNLVNTSTKNITLLLKDKANAQDLFQKTLVIGNILEQNLQWKISLQIYQNYLKQASYKKATIQLLIQRNFLYQSLDDFCLKYGEYSFSQETEREKQDRQILNTHCANNIKIKYPIEFSFFARKDKQYRVNSWNLSFLLYLNKIKKIQKELLNPFEKQKYLLFLAQEELEKENYDSVFSILKQAENLLLTSKNEQQIYLLKARIYLLQNKKEEAINHFVKLLYSSSQETTQILLILRIIPLMIEKNWHQEAIKIFIQIEKKKVPKELQPQYFQVSKELLLIQNLQEK